MKVDDRLRAGARGATEDRESTPAAGSTGDASTIRGASMQRGAQPVSVVFDSATALTPLAPSELASASQALQTNLRAHFAKLGAPFPQLSDGDYSLMPDRSFAVPFERALERAREHGQNDPLSFVAGEAAVRLTRIQFGHDRPDLDARNNPLLRLVQELVETGYALEIAKARCPNLEPDTTHYAHTVWSKLLHGVASSGAPPLLVALVRELLATRVSTLPRAELPLDERGRALLDAARGVVRSLTAAPEPGVLEELFRDTARSSATARKRIEQTKDELWPLFLELAAIAMPPEQRPTTSAEARPGFVTADAAKAKLKGPQRTLSSEVTAIDPAHVHALIQFIDCDAEARRMGMGHRPSAAGVLRCAKLLRQRQQLPSRVQLEPLVEATLRVLHGRTGTTARFAEAGATSHDTTPDAAPWSPAYLAPLAGPLLELSATLRIEKPRTDESDEVRGVGAFFERRGLGDATTQWLATAEEAHKRRSEDSALIEWLSRQSGATGELGRALHDLSSTCAGAIERVRTARDERRSEANAVVTEQRAVFEAASRRFDELFLLVVALGRNPTDWQPAPGVVLPPLRPEDVLAGAARLAAKQEDALARLELLLTRYRSAVQPLADLLGPRLEWRAESTVPGSMSDPLQPLLDSTWLPSVVLALEAAQDRAQRLTGAVASMPAQHPARAGLDRELEASGPLAARLVEEAARELVKKLRRDASEAPRAAASAAAVSPTRLPALARTPRLCTLARSLKLFEPELDPMKRWTELEGITFTSPREPWGRRLIDDHVREVSRRLEDGHEELHAWLRTLDPAAAPVSVVAELARFETHHAPVLERLLATTDEGERRQSELDRSLGELVALHERPLAPILLTDLELGQRQRALRETLERGTTRGDARERLLAYFDPGLQPNALLIEALRHATKLEDRQLARELVTKLTTSPDRGMRAAARDALAKLEGTSPAAWAQAQLTLNDAADERALALLVLDALLGPDTKGDKPQLLRDALVHAAPLVRAAALYSARTLLLTDGSEPASSLSACAEGVVHAVRDTPVALPGLRPLLQAIATSDELAAGVVTQARAALETLEQRLERASQTAALPIHLHHGAAARPEDVDAQLTWAAAVAASRGRPIDALGTQLAVAAHLMTRIEGWSLAAQGTSTKALADALDLSINLVDGAVALAAGDAPIRHVQSKAVHEALIEAGTFSPAELELLTTGKLPESLVRAAARALMTTPWAIEDLAPLRGDATSYEATLSARAWLTRDTNATARELVAEIFAGNPASASIAYGVLCELAGGALPLVDPALTPSARSAALATPSAANPRIAREVEGALLHTLESKPLEGQAARAYVELLALLPSEAADTSLGRAFERARTPELQVELLRVAARRAGQRRGVLRGIGAREHHWLTTVLHEEPRLDLERALALRSAIERLRDHAETNADADRAAQRLAQLAAQLLGSRNPPDAKSLEAMGEILAVASNDRVRQALVEGVATLARNAQVDWEASLWSAVRDGLLVVDANLHHGDGAANVQHFLELIARAQTARPRLTATEIGLLAELYATAPSHPAKLKQNDALIKTLRLTERHADKLDAKALRAIIAWVDAVSDRAVAYEQERIRSLAIECLPELIPLGVDRIEALARVTPGLRPERLGGLLRRVTDEKLRAHEIETLGAPQSAESKSRLGSLFGKLTQGWSWSPSDQRRFFDPLAFGSFSLGGSAELRGRLRHGLERALSSLDPRPTILSGVSEWSEGSAGEWSIGAWATKSQKGIGDTEQLANPNLVTSLSEQRQAADAMIAKFRAQNLAGKRPYDQVTMVYNDEIQLLARGLDSLFERRVEDEHEQSTEGGMLNANRLAMMKIQHRALAKAAEEAAARGDEKAANATMPMAPIFDSIVPNVTRTTPPKILTLLVVDCSGSTKEDNRLAHFKSVGTVVLEANERVKNAHVETGLIAFHDSARILLNPARSHEHKVKAAAFESMKPDGGTNDVAATHLAHQLAQAKAYDHVVVIFLTDGQGQGSQGGLVANLEKQSRMVFAGIGVSADARHVGKTYRTSMLEDDPKRLVSTMFKFYKDEVIGANR